MKTTHLLKIRFMKLFHFNIKRHENVANKGFIVEI